MGWSLCVNSEKDELGLIDVNEALLNIAFQMNRKKMPENNLQYEAYTIFIRIYIGRNDVG